MKYTFLPYLQITQYQQFIFLKIYESIVSCVFLEKTKEFKRILR